MLRASHQGYVRCVLTGRGRLNAHQYVEGQSSGVRCRQAGLTTKYRLYFNYGIKVISNKVLVRELYFKYGILVL